jgi:hypothetical protein
MEAVMPSSRWKAVELAICKIFGGQRSGPVGKEGPDCTGTGHYAIQVKHRKVPKWLTDAVEQARGDARWQDLPLVALHPKGKSIDETLIIIRLDDFREWFI